MQGMNITIHLLTHDGRALSLVATPGDGLMRAATRAGVAEIAADCGGCLSCATCHVYIHADWLALLQPADADESAMLDMTAAQRRPNSRLSCQIILKAEHDGQQAELPDRQY